MPAAYGDPTKVRLAPAGRIFVAPVGTALPTDVLTTLNVAFKELGYVDENGVQVTPNVDSFGVPAWQSAVDVKTGISKIGVQLKFTAIQVTKDTTAQYFFGASWTNTVAIGKLDMPSNPSLAARAMVIEWSDDAVVPNTNRLVFGNGFITDRDAMQLQRTQATVLGMTFQVLDNSGNLGYWLTNDANLAS